MTNTTSPRPPHEHLLFLVALLALLALFSRTAAIAQVCVQPPQGIVAWWPLDETNGSVAADIGGSHPAVHFGTPVPDRGKVAGAYRFNGSSFLAAADSPLWAFGARAFTIELWANFGKPFNPIDPGGSLHHPTYIFLGNDERAGNFNKWFLALSAAPGGFLNLHINSPTLGPKFFPLAPFSPQLEHWYHIAITRTGALYTIFVDGSAIGSAMNADAVPDPDASLTIGQAESLGFFRGSLDEVTIYERALRPTEIRAIADAGAGGKCKQQSAIAPDRGGDTGEVTVRITGSGFTAESRVRLTRGGDEISGEDTQLLDSRSIATTFDLTGRALGAWDVIVDSEDGTAVSIPAGFLVEQGLPPALWVQIVGRGAIMGGRPQTFSLVFGNRGNINAHLVPLWLAGIPADAQWQLGTNLAVPPTPQGLPNIDWDRIPVGVRGAKGVGIPLLIPTLPPGTTRVLTFSLTVPGSHQWIELRAWMGLPLVSTSAGEARFSDNPNACIAALLEAIVEIVDLPVPDVVACIDSLRAYLFSIKDAADEGSMYSWYQVLLAGSAAAIDCAGLIPQLNTLVHAVEVAMSVVNVVDKCTPFLLSDGPTVARIQVVTSHDPNAKSGVLGSGPPDHYIGSGQTPAYIGDIENLAEASGPAQRVVITDLLDTSRFDIDSVQFGVITFGNRWVEPPPRSQSFAITVDLRPQTNLLLRIEAGVDKASGLLTWRFTSIDPSTGEAPEDPFVGFLPPNARPPEGQGSVLFTVAPRQDLPTGTVIRNTMRITFDYNEPITTAEWLNTLDRSIPESHCLPLETTQNATSFVVGWAGSDEDSGIRDFSIFVSRNGGPFELWLDSVAATSGVFTGVAGGYYAFYSTARDQAGNLEDSPERPDTTTRILTNRANRTLP